ncbi:MAG: hypothetical protein ACRYG4_11815, partial [Janthinobacterium lividum]
MSSVSYQPLPDQRRAPLGRRAIGFLLVVAVHILLAIMLFMLTPTTPRRRDEAEPKSFTLVPIPPPPVKRAPAPPKKQAVGGASPRSHARPTKAKTAAATNAPPVPSTVPSKPFGTELFDAVDIAALPNHRSDRA